MHIATQSNNDEIKKQRRTESKLSRRFGSEMDVKALTGISERTLQKDRLLGRSKFPWYRVGGRVLYDLDEVVAIIKASRSIAA